MHLFVALSCRWSGKAVLPAGLVLRMLAGGIHPKIPTVLRSSVCQRFHARTTSICYDCTSLTPWSDNFTILFHSLALLI